MSLPTTTPAWLLKEGDAGEFPWLELARDVPIPPLGSRDVLVRIEAVSLNYRDLMIAQVRTKYHLSKLRSGLMLTIARAHTPLV